MKEHFINSVKLWTILNIYVKSMLVVAPTQLEDEYNLQISLIYLAEILPNQEGDRWWLHSLLWCHYFTSSATTRHRKVALLRSAFTLLIRQIDFLWWWGLYRDLRVVLASRWFRVCKPHSTKCMVWRHACFYSFHELAFKSTELVKKLFNGC